MDRVDVAGDLRVFFQLTGWLRLAEINHAGIVAAQQDVGHFSHPGHQNGRLHAPVDCGENRSPLRAVAVPDVGEPLRVNIETRQQQVDSAAQIHQGLKFDFAVDLRLIEMVGSFMPRLRAIPRVVRDEGNRAGSGVKFSFGNEFSPGAVSPMAKKNRSEWALSFRNDQVRPDGAALGTRVGDVMKGAAFKLFEDLVVDVEWLFRVVVEEMGSNQEIR